MNERIQELEAQGGAEMAKPTAYLEWSLHVDCPQCGESNNLAKSNHDSEYRIAKYVFTNNWDKLSGWEVTCEHCNHEFELEEVVY